MKTLKKTLCLVLAVVMAVGVLVIPANAATEFTDDADITHDEAVAVLSGLSIVNGKGDGTFDPDGNFTRGQAAILLAQVVLTPEDAALLTDTKADFSDVPVTSNYNKYVTWAVQEGYIHGYTDGTFKPNKELTGLDLAALMLEVLGEELDSSNLKNFVALKTKEYGLSEGITAYSASKVISRDDAVQMMFNAMKYDPNGETRYQVKIGDTDYGTYDTLTEALVMMRLLGDTNGQPTPVTVGNDNILNNTYNVTHNTANKDIFGRPTTTWTKDAGKKTEEDLYLEENTPVAGPYYTAKTLKDIFVTDLKLDITGTKSVQAKLFIDGDRKEMSAGHADRTDTNPNNIVEADVSTNASNYVMGGQGSETTVYKNGDVYEIYVLTTHTQPVTADNLKNGAVELIAKKGDVPAQTFENVAVGDVVIWQGTADEVYKAQKAEIKNGRITGKSTSTTDHYFLVEGSKTYLSAAYLTTSSAFNSFGAVTVNKDNVYNVWTDFQGNAIQIALDTGDITITAPNYVYVAEYVTTDATPGTTLGSASTAPYAQARLYNLSTGELTTENIAIAQNDSGVWCLADRNGLATGYTLADDVRFTESGGVNGAGFASYELTADGDYVLTPVTATTGKVVTSNEATVAEKKANIVVEGVTYYANSTSKIVTVNRTGSALGSYRYAAPAETIGYTNFAEITNYVKVLLLSNDSKVVDTLYVIRNAEGEVTPASTKDIALFMSKGDTDLNGTPYTFLIEGKATTYYCSNDNLSVTEGEVYKLTFSRQDASILASAEPDTTKLTKVPSAKVAFVSDGYIITGVDTFTYLTSDCMVYNLTDHVAATSVPASTSTENVNAVVYTLKSGDDVNKAFIIVYTHSPVTAG